MIRITYAEADALRENADHPALPIDGRSYPHLADEEGWVRVTGGVTRELRIGAEPPWPRNDADRRRRFLREFTWRRRRPSCRECGEPLDDRECVIVFLFFGHGYGRDAYLHADPCPVPRASR